MGIRSYVAVIQGISIVCSSMFLELLCNLTVFYRYDQGAHFFLPSFIMRTHGAKQQRIVIKRTPKEQLEPVFEVRVPLSVLRVNVA